MIKEVEEQDRKELAQVSRPDNWNDEINGKWKYKEAGIRSENDDPKYY